MPNPAARVGDKHVCPMITPGKPSVRHVGGLVLSPGDPLTLVGGPSAARLGDMAHCVGLPDSIAMGSATVLIGGQLAARKTDTTVHEGTIVQGCPAVLIGGPKVKIGGHGTPADALLVAAALARMPESALLILERQGTTFVACEGSVTDYRPDLKGVQPRGWDAGKTWDIVPGANMPGRNEVVIATVGQETPAGAHIPTSGEGHGSYDLVLHEGGHAVDLDGGATPRSSDPAFQSARNADVGNLTPYEAQAGGAGEEETYAESFARHFGGDPTSSTSIPNIDNYWNSHP